MINNNELIDQIKSYNRFLNSDSLNKAYNFALEAHQNQKRDEGVPYIIHPVAVAKILTDLHSKNQTKKNHNEEVVMVNSKEIENFLEEFDKIDVDDISPRQSLDFLYQLKSKRHSNGKSKFKK